MKVIVNKPFEQKSYEGVEKISLPSLLGEATILNDHIPMVADVNGEITLFYSEERTEKILTENAIVSVDKDIIEVFC